MEEKNVKIVDKNQNKKKGAFIAISIGVSFVLAIISAIMVNI